MKSRAKMTNEQEEEAHKRLRKKRLGTVDTQTTAYPPPGVGRGVEGRQGSSVQEKRQLPQGSQLPRSLAHTLIPSEHFLPILRMRD